MRQTKITVKTLLVAAISFGIAGGMTSCKKEGCTDEKATNYNADAKKDDGSCEYPAPTPEPTEVEKSGNITTSETWSASKIYYLKGKVVVTGGATLTIEPGTIIKGRTGQEAAASALVVAKDGKIMAQGTADKPIIFTSELDDITFGQKVGSNLTRSDNEKWGGVVLLGDAPSSTENGDTEGNIEGIPPGDGYGKYGGSNAGHNAGVLEYVSIRHGGISIGEGNELNALTLGGVGNGTKISYVEIYATLDDGIECFGGTVNIDNALVYYQGDDGLDIDQSYSGTIQNFAVIHGDGIGTDEGVEIDGPEGTLEASFTIKNGTCMRTGTADGSAGDYKSKAMGTTENVTFTYNGKEVKLRTKFDKDKNCENKSDAYENAVDNKLIFTNVKNSDGYKAYDGDDPATAECADILTSINSRINTLLKGDGAGGSYDYKSAFSWGAAGQRGEL